MVASLFTNLLLVDGWISLPFVGLSVIFQLWMFIHAVRNREWVWAIFIWCFSFVSALLYYFQVYRYSGSSQGFELPGAAKRKRIKELQAQIHHLDHAVHHFQLGDVYFRNGKLPKAEACYRAALERDPKDIDARAHLGQCLMLLKRPAEARPLLEGVCAEEPKHDFGYSMMALAETLSALGEQNAALSVWQTVTANHSYPRAKVQLAELYLAKNQPELARAELNDVLADDLHAPAFQRKRDRVWVRRARAVWRKLPA